MKKTLLPVLLMLLVLLFVYTASAQTNEILPVEGKYHVTYDAGSENYGKTYIITVVRGIENYSITPQNTVYINSAVCDENGIVLPEGFVPVEICDSTVLISGAGLDEPTVYGIIYGPDVTGKIEYYGSGNATVTLVSQGNIIETVTTDSQGNYTLENAANGGEYTLTVTKNGYLSYTAVRTVSDNIIPDINIKSAAGDLDGSGKILINDLVLLIESLSASASTADFNSDGTVDRQDLVILINNFNRLDIIE